MNFLNCEEEHDCHALLHLCTIGVLDEHPTYVNIWGRPQLSTLRAVTDLTKIVQTPRRDATTSHHKFISRLSILSH